MQREFIFLALLICLLTFSSCDNLHGKIEQRFNSYYLVNKSKTESYKFTIKETSIQDDHLYSFSTQIIGLSPGDEKYLGEKTSLTEVEYPIIEKQSFTTWKPFTKEELKQDEQKIAKEKDDGTYDPFILSKSEINESFGYGFDTIINGQKLKYKYVTHKYYDKKHPLPIKHFKYNYEVTGEILLKN